MASQKELSDALYAAIVALFKEFPSHHRTTEYSRDAALRCISYGWFVSFRQRISLCDVPMDRVDTITALIFD